MACPLNYSLTITGDCSNTNSGGFTIDISGTAPDFTIQWLNPSYGTIPLGTGVSAYTINSLSAGTYTFNVIDSCVSPSATIVPVNVFISSGTCVSITAEENTTCGFDNGSLTASTTNLYGIASFYLYENTNGYITSGSSNTNDFTFTTLSAGTYYVIGDDGAGCTGKSETCIIKDSSLFDYGFYVVNDAGCAVDSGKIFITGLTGNPPYTYLWDNSETTSSITGLTAGTYSVSVTDAYGCMVSKSAIVNEVPVVGLGTITSTNPTCFTSDGSVTITVTGGTAPYYYSGSNGSTNITFDTSYTFDNLASGSFTIQVTDAGLCTFTASTSILPANGFTVVSVGVVSSTCNNNQGQLNPIQLFGAPGNYTYTLQYPDGHLLTQSTSSQSWQFDNLSGGTYYLTIDDGVCSFTSAYTINNTVKFILTADTTSTTCGLTDGEIEVGISGSTGPYTYSIGGQTFGPTGLSGYTFTGLPSGPYTVTAVDSTLCQQTVNVVIPYSVNTDFILNGIDSTNGSNGSITTFITDGEPPFTLSWSLNVNGQTGTTVTSLSAGTYSLTVVDDNGCTITKSITLNGVNNLTSYQTYSICDDDFVNGGTQIRKGPREMLNEGFYDLTVDDYNCILNSAIFEAYVSVSGQVLTQEFYTGTTLNEYPLDNQWYDVVTSLLLEFDGIGNVNIDSVNNTITVTTDCDPSVNLSDAQVIVNMVIYYDISCVQCSVQPSPTPTVTPTKTPTQTPTPTVTPTRTPTNVLTCLGVNLNFNNNLNGWDVTPFSEDSWVWSANYGGSALYTGEDEGGYLSQDILTVGTTYNVSFDIYYNPSVTPCLDMSVFAGGTEHVITPSDGVSTVSFNITCTSNSTFSIYCLTACFDELFVDNVCVIEIPATPTPTPTNTTTPTVTPTKTPTPTPTPSPGLPDVYSVLSNRGVVCSELIVWENYSVDDVKCEFTQAFNPLIGVYGSSYYYYSSIGFNIGTQLYTSIGTPLTISGNYVYGPSTYPAGPNISSTPLYVVTIVNGVITNITNFNDIPSCGTYVCPSPTPTVTPTKTPTPTPTITPTITPTKTPTPTPTPTPCDCTRYEISQTTGPVVEVVNCDGQTQLIRGAGYGNVSDTIFVCSTVLPTVGSWDTLVENGSCCSEFDSCSGYTITNLDSGTLDIFYTDCTVGFTSTSLPVGESVTVCSYSTPYSPGFPSLSMTYDGPC